MLARVRSKLTYANVVSTLCLFIVLGGGAYAVGSGNIKAVKKVVRSLAPRLSVGHASKADSATNADQLGGSPPASFLSRCPSGTTRAGADLCMTSSDVGTGGFGRNNFAAALQDCANLGLRMPSPAEALLLVTRLLGQTWTDDFWVNGSTSTALGLDPSTGNLLATDSSSALRVRCVTTPVDA